MNIKPLSRSDTRIDISDIPEDKLIPGIKQARIRKPKSNYKVDKDKFSPIDFCQTPPEALLPLYDFIPAHSVIWESAAGGRSLVTAFKNNGYGVYDTDLQDGDAYNFFEFAILPELYFAQITNPPYGIKRQWVQRSYELGKPFCLLMPVEFLGTQGLHKLWKEYGQTQQIFFTQRINFHMPIKGSENKETGWKSSAQFPTCWYCWNMNLPRDNMVYDLKTKDWWIK